MYVQSDIFQCSWFVYLFIYLPPVLLQSSVFSVSVKGTWLLKLEAKKEVTVPSLPLSDISKSCPRMFQNPSSRQHHCHSLSPGHHPFLTHCDL